MRLFELGEYPKNGRLSTYEKELIKLIKTEDDDGILSFSEKVFTDCINYLQTSFNMKIPNLYLTLMNHKDYTELCDRLDLLLGKIPRTNAIIVYRVGRAPEVCVDFEKHFSFFISTRMPVNFLVNLIASYLEELIHSADFSKTETEIHQFVCDAFEDFAEVKLTEKIKRQRFEYAKKVDNKKL
jgi:hypothetical protein